MESYGICLSLSDSHHSAQHCLVHPCCRRQQDCILSVAESHSTVRMCTTSSFPVACGRAPGLLHSLLGHRKRPCTAPVAVCLSSAGFWVPLVTYPEVELLGPSLSLGLNSILPGVRIVTPAFCLFPFPRKIFFHPVMFSLWVPFNLR